MSARTAVLTRLSGLALAAVSLLTAPAQAQDVPDALNLQITPETTTAEGAKPLRLMLEAGGGRVDLRDGGHDDVRLLSIDLRYSGKLSEAWRWTLSDRYDHVSPALGGQRPSSNSLRELALSWQEPGAMSAVDVGRVNHRQGPAYGFNPTDWFRRGALRTVTTADPVALRERRLGTAMVRVTRLSEDTGLTFIAAPKLDDGPDPRAAAVDWGATNDSDRVMLGASLRRGANLNGQASLLIERGQSAKLGANFSALAGDSLVVFGEAVVGRFQPLIERVVPTGLSKASTGQAALGATYTFGNDLSVTIEADYNGAGLNERQWQTLLANGAPAYQRYLAVTQSSQEQGMRRAWLLYLSQKGLGLKRLDLTAFVRGNADDGSRMLWAELRYHWTRVDGVLQWQRSQGHAPTEFGLLPMRESVRLSVVFYL